MHIQRFFVSAVPLNLSGQNGVVSYEGRLLGAAWLFKVILEHDAQPEIEARLGMAALPSLNAPASSLGPTIFASFGVTPGAGDTVLNVLRAWRNSKGEGSSFDISASS